MPFAGGIFSIGGMHSVPFFCGVQARGAGTKVPYGNYFQNLTLNIAPLTGDVAVVPYRGLFDNKQLAPTIAKICPKCSITSTI